ncbi:unnamed protein product [Camellia sinensis]
MDVAPLYQILTCQTQHCCHSIPQRWFFRVPRIVTRTTAVMSRRGVLGYQEGNTLPRPPRPRPRRTLPKGVFSRPTPPPRVAADPIAPRVPVIAVAPRRKGVPEPTSSGSSSRIAMPPIDCRRRANNTVMSSGLDNLSLDSGIENVNSPATQMEFFTQTGNCRRRRCENIIFHKPSYQIPDLPMKSRKPRSVNNEEDNGYFVNLKMLGFGGMMMMMMGWLYSAHVSVKIEVK